MTAINPAVRWSFKTVIEKLQDLSMPFVGIFVGLQHVTSMQESLRALLQAPWDQVINGVEHFFKSDVSQAEISAYMQEV